MRGGPGNPAVPEAALEVESFTCFRPELRGVRKKKSRANASGFAPILAGAISRECQALVLKGNHQLDGA